MAMREPKPDDLAQTEREERSVIVAGEYLVEATGPMSYVVMHPEETERCYLVDMTAPECSCPDFWGYCAQRAIWCKHIWAIAKLIGAELPKRRPLPLGDNPLKPEEVVCDAGRVREQGAIVTADEIAKQDDDWDPFKI